MASKGDINSNDVQPILYSNWIKISFEDSLGKIGAFTKLKSKDFFELGTIPVVDQGEKLIAGYVNDEKLSYKGSAPVIIFGDHTRNLKYIDFKFAIGADGTKIIKPLEIFNSKFYFFYLKSLKIPDFGYSRHYKVLKSIHIPLPPLAEQERIVAKLDSLFAELDTIKERLANIPTLLKNFRQSVLNQAVTGKLTEEWREGKEFEDVRLMVKEFLLELLKKEKSISKKKNLETLIKVTPYNEYEIPPSWSFFNLEQLCLSFTYGTSTKSLNTGTTPVLRMGNLQDGKIDWNKLKYTSDKKEIDKYLLNRGDLLFNRTNSPELVGKTSIYKGANKAIYAGYLIRIKTGYVLDSDYLNYILNSPYGRKWSWSVKSDGVSQSNINAKKLSQFNIPFPPKEEQQEVVKRIEALFKQADSIEAHYEALVKRIEVLPQAILAKAFKGELVPQLPTDGDAKELLAEIKKLKSAVSSSAVKNKKKRTTKK
nr:hypothetical protein BACT7_17780 [Tenacibaculum mesophilum]